MPKALTVKAPAKTTINDTGGTDPLTSFLTDRDGWVSTETGWAHAAKSVAITVLLPGNANRFQCSIKGSKPVTFGTRAAVECWVITAGA